MIVGPVDIGSGIIHYEGDEPETLARLAGKLRFLNDLWLPSTLSALRPEQIAVISRYREARILTDPQFLQANKARRAVINACRASGATAMLEIGCGIFPLQPELSEVAYLGLEIDPVAINQTRKSGIQVCSPTEVLQHAGALRPDSVVGVYSLHFALGEEIFEVLREHATFDAVLLACVILDDTAHFITTLSKLNAAGWPDVRVIKRTGMARKEVYLIAGKPGSSHRIVVCTNALSEVYAA